MSIALVVNTLNEEHNIADCIESALGLVDEVVVCDMHSDDRTVEIAQSLGARVVYHERTGYVEPARQFACENATQDWILVLDADERVTRELAAEIREELSSPMADVYGIPRLNWMFGTWARFGSWAHERPERLFRKGAITWRDGVHSSPIVSGQKAFLTSPMLHHAHPTIEVFLDKLNRYTSIEAKEMFDAGRRVRLLTALFGAARAFVGQYVRLQGFRDGGHGLILAALMAFYDFTKHAKLWVLWYQHDHPEARQPKWK